MFCLVYFTDCLRKAMSPLQLPKKLGKGHPCRSCKITIQVRDGHDLCQERLLGDHLLHRAENKCTFFLGLGISTYQVRCACGLIWEAQELFQQLADLELSVPSQPSIHDWSSPGPSETQSKDYVEVHEGSGDS